MPAVLLAAGLGGLLLLGAIQGATEFLPVSSSGHLVLFGEWLGFDSEVGLAREVALHFGTLVAVVLFCWKDLLSMLRSGSAGLWKLVIPSAAVTAGLGLTLEDPIEQHLGTPVGAGCGLLVTTLLLLVIAPRNDEKQTRSLSDGTIRDGIVLGLLQSLALWPGVSRAGSTIVAALLLGFARPHAVRVAFLMSIPVVGGAVLLKLVGDAEGAAVAWTPSMGLAMAVACVVGLGALKFISVRVDARSLRGFGVYTLALGVLALVLSLGWSGGGGGAPGSTAGDGEPPEVSAASQPAADG